MNENLKPKKLTAAEKINAILEKEDVRDAIDTWRIVGDRPYERSCKDLQDRKEKQNLIKKEE